VSLDSPVQLLLHGSAEHLVGHQSRPEVHLHFRDFSGEPLYLPRVLGILADFANPASQISGSIDPRESSPPQSPLSLYQPDTLSAELFRRICGFLGPTLSTAVMMTGFARVTLHPGGDPRTIVATPLFVEYADRYSG
jgi:hypothetical protein